jgi:hypothetical protein
MRKLFSIASSVLILLVAGPAFAAELDFRSSSFTSADGDPSFNYTASDGIQVRLQPGPSGATLYQDSTDGIGVRYSYETDEIEGRERLTISFSQSGASQSVLITDLYLTDLFVERTSGGTQYAEVGYYTVNGSTTTFHAVQPTGTNGELHLSPDVWASAITFSAPGIVGSQNHEYSVAGLSYTTRSGSVPELDPSAAAGALVLLLGSVLLLTERRRLAC